MGVIRKTPNPKGYKKATQHEAKRRVDQVHQWLSECKTRATIIRLAQSQWGSGVGEANIDLYIRKARKQIVEHLDQVDRKQWIAAAVEQLQQVAESSCANGQHSNAIGALNAQAKLLGMLPRDN